MQVRYWLRGGGGVKKSEDMVHGPDKKMEVIIATNLHFEQWFVIFVSNTDSNNHVTQKQTSQKNIKSTSC